MLRFFDDTEASRRRKRRRSTERNAFAFRGFRNKQGLRALLWFFEGAGNGRTNGGAGCY
jgi:hypothetical protein